MIRPLLLVALALVMGAGCGGTRPAFESALRPGLVAAPLDAVVVFAGGLGADGRRVLEAALVEDTAGFGGDVLLGGGPESEGIAETAARARARGATTALRVTLIGTEVVATYAPPTYGTRVLDDRFRLGDGFSRRLDIPNLATSGGTEYRARGAV